MANAKEVSKQLEHDEHLAAWHACLALERAMETCRQGSLPIAQLMDAAFQAGKATALYRARRDL